MIEFIDEGNFGNTIKSYVVELNNLYSISVVEYLDQEKKYVSCGNREKPYELALLYKSKISKDSAFYNNIEYKKYSSNLMTNRYGELCLGFLTEKEVIGIIKYFQNYFKEENNGNNN